MLEIVSNEINAVNGLGDGDGSGNGINWTDVIKTTLEVGGDVAETAIKEKNSGGSSSSGSSSDYSINLNTRDAGSNSKKNNNINNYLPWIIGGLGVLLLFGMMTMNNNNKK